MKTLREFIFYLTILFCIPFDQTYGQSSKDPLRYGLPVLPGVSGFGQDAVGGKGGIVNVQMIKYEV